MRDRREARARWMASLRRAMCTTPQAHLLECRSARGVNPAKPDANGTNVELRGRKGDMREGGIRVPGIIE